MNNTMPNVKKTIKPELIDRNKLRKAQRLIKANYTSWPWKLCMHMAKQAYGIECDSPMPEIGDRNGNVTCTHVDTEKGEYVFLSERALCHREMNGYVIGPLEVNHD